MSEVYTAIAIDNTKNRYLFYVYDKNECAEFPNDLSAVYMFVRETKCKDNKVCYQPLYVGETGELGIRFSKHHKEKECASFGYTHIFVRPTPPCNRNLIETVLFHHYVPICNDQSLPECLNNKAYIENARNLRIGRSEKKQNPMS